MKGLGTGQVTSRDQVTRQIIHARALPALTLSRPSCPIQFSLHNLTRGLTWTKAKLSARWPPTSWVMSPVLGFSLSGWVVIL